MDSQLVAFIGVAIVVVVLPGPDMALVARNVLRHGRSAGFATSIGICTGTIGWALAAAFGVSALLAASAIAFTALKLAGAAYLIFLGVTTLRSHDVADADGTTAAPGLRWPRAWLQGTLSSLLNPKLGVFFLTLLPQFVAPGDPPTLRIIQLALLFDLIGLIWLLMYSTMLGAIGAVLNRPGPRRAMRWITGTILVGLGVRVALDRA